MYLCHSRFRAKSFQSSPKLKLGFNHGFALNSYMFFSAFSWCEVLSSPDKIKGQILFVSTVFSSATITSLMEMSVSQESEEWEGKPFYVSHHKQGLWPGTILAGWGEVRRSSTQFSRATWIYLSAPLVNTAALNATDPEQGPLSCFLSLR